MFHSSKRLHGTTVSNLATGRASPSIEGFYRPRFVVRKGGLGGVQGSPAPVPCPAAVDLRATPSDGHQCHARRCVWHRLALLARHVRVGLPFDAG